MMIGVLLIGVTMLMSISHGVSTVLPKEYPTIPVIDLTGDVEICPEDYNDGFQLRCIGPNLEAGEPFFLTEIDETGLSKAIRLYSALHHAAFRSTWSYGYSRNVTCDFITTSFTSVITFQCELSSVEPSQLPQQLIAPGTMFFRSADTTNLAQSEVEITSGVTFCPTRDLGTTNFTVYCEPSETSVRAFFRINGQLVFMDDTRPYYIFGDVDFSPNAWTGAPTNPFTIVCALGSGIKSVVMNVKIGCEAEESSIPNPSDEFLEPTGPPGCVVINAKGTILSEGWVDDHIDGITFQAGNKSKRITKAGISPLYYTFTVPLPGRYALVVDMTTRGRADYNDIHIRVKPGGVQLMNRESVGTVKSWIKGYHAFFARAAKISSQLAHLPHSISTANNLEMDTEYSIGISGRSNQVTVHQIALFLCEGSGCERRKWKDSQERCLPGSTLYTPKPRPIRP